MTKRLLRRFEKQAKICVGERQICWETPGLYEKRDWKDGQFCTEIDIIWRIQMQQKYKKFKMTEEMSKRSFISNIIKTKNLFQISNGLNSLRFIHAEVFISVIRSFGHRLPFRSHEASGCWRYNSWLLWRKRNYFVIENFK